MSCVEERRRDLTDVPHEIHLWRENKDDYIMLLIFLFASGGRTSEALLKNVHNKDRKTLFK